MHVLQLDLLALVVSLLMKPAPASPACLPTEEWKIWFQNYSAERRAIVFPYATPNLTKIVRTSELAEFARRNKLEQPCWQSEASKGSPEAAELQIRALRGQRLLVSYGQRVRNTTALIALVGSCADV